MSKREILFRGKRVDNGKWVEGDLSHYVLVGETHICRMEDNLFTTIHKIDQETICRYTGYKDDTGKRILRVMLSALRIWNQPKADILKRVVAEKSVMTKEKHVSM